MRQEYEEILGLEHVQSKTRPRMSMEGRAAQFSPFSALTGFEEAIRRTQAASAQAFCAETDGDEEVYPEVPWEDIVDAEDGSCAGV